MRAAVERLGGRGGADVLAVARRIHGPLLVVHGDQDPTVPVSQSRALRHHLRRPGHARLEYLEVPGVGHDPLAASVDARATLTRFLRGG
jgi:dipeptidyl aminopeptidase/acylaminoacyl peptidase